ncbi:unsaturated chondroitin disaccharide hydrolase [Micromonospora haikouensis]|uniref:Unsaturated chondroitin disaccharide hydrolase n=1 Tax=Micromonospora haikouensis TaxID=686309 RepID=A0A1C4YDT0_9ACTN|nr:hypothetical protein [Micromonospora haikouensis]SCF18922.1 unsaturated chondroitin disaccharide hydrolase [Micromonospora haikouensis]
MNDHGYDNALEAMLRRLPIVAGQVGDRFPLYADPVSGEWVSTRRGSWTGGFWAGWWWLLAAVTGLPSDQATAREWTHRLAPRAAEDTVTRGMTFWYGAAQGYRVCADTSARRVALDGADALAGAFDGRLGLIPVGNAFGAGPLPKAGVDALAGTVSLLRMAADAGRYHLDGLARSHADRHVQLLVGGDGRIQPEVLLRPDGTPVDESSPSAAWARGQAWGVLGLAACARQWGGDFTKAGCRAGQWWLEQVGHTVPVAVLGRPATPVDTSAAAITAAGLLTLAEVTADGGWGVAARAIVDGVIGHHLDDTGVLRDGCYELAGGVGTRHELVWGSYFLTAVLAVLTGRVREHPW